MGHPLSSAATPRTRSTRRPSPEPADNGRASATSLVMRRPVRGHECVSRPRGAWPLALRYAKPEPQEVLGAASRHTAPALETKTALTARAAGVRLLLFYPPVSDPDRTDEICLLTGGGLIGVGQPRVESAPGQVASGGGNDAPARRASRRRSAVRGDPPRSPDRAAVGGERAPHDEPGSDAGRLQRGASSSPDPRRATRNAGRRGSPRIRAGDLPKRPSPRTSAGCGGYDVEADARDLEPALVRERPGRVFGLWLRFSVLYEIELPGAPPRSCARRPGERGLCELRSPPPGRQRWRRLPCRASRRRRWQASGAGWRGGVTAPQADGWISTRHHRPTPAYRRGALRSATSSSPWYSTRNPRSTK